jgi:osmotically-inducible protein OsmY
MGNARDIREAVEEELREDPLVDAAGITVRNVSGNVALTGTVPSLTRANTVVAAIRSPS